MAESKVEHLLDSIHFPEDLRHLSQDKLEQVCADLRQYIIDVLSENPGHLGASLGTVELTVALHYVFNTPYDRIVWDVGHQAYGHKILTAACSYGSAAPGAAPTPRPSLPPHRGCRAARRTPPSPPARRCMRS